MELQGEIERLEIDRRDLEFHVERTGTENSTNLNCTNLSWLSQ